MSFPETYVLIDNEAAEFLNDAVVVNIPQFIRQFKAEGVFNTGKIHQTVRLRIFHAFVEEVRRSIAFLALFGAIKLWSEVLPDESITVKMHYINSYNLTFSLIPNSFHVTQIQRPVHAGARFTKSLSETGQDPV